MNLQKKLENKNKNMKRKKESAGEILVVSALLRTGKLFRKRI
jgi:hypothetical protein